MGFSAFKGGFRIFPGKLGFPHLCRAWVLLAFSDKI